MTVLVINVFGDIGCYSAADLAMRLEYAPEGDVEVRICSDGGSVFEGLAMYHTLRASGRKVITKNFGLAASMASVLFLAGDERIMYPGSMLMLHSPWGPAGMDQELLAKTKASLVGIYSSVTGKTEAKIEKMLEGETWLDSSEAVALGFATASPEPDETYSLEPLAKLNIEKVPGAPRALVALVAKAREGKGGIKMDLKQLSLILGLPETASIEEIAQSIEALKGTTVSAEENLDSAVAKLPAKLQAQIEGLRLKAKASEDKAYQDIFSSRPDVFTPALVAKAKTWPIDVVKEFVAAQAPAPAPAEEPARPSQEVPQASALTTAMKQYAKATGRTVAQVQAIYAQKDKLKFPVKFVSELGGSK